jgi:pyridoxine kinase
MARVLAISSQVVRGHVGLSATVPALQWMGHEVWALPTLLLASRPGLGHPSRQELDLSAMLSALEADGCWPMLDAVFTGYFPSASAVHAAADAIVRIKQAQPKVMVCVDPILGDAGRLYVTQATAEAIRDRLIPLADIATPNLFELCWLSESSHENPDAIVRAARGLGPATVIVTSAFEARNSVVTLLVRDSASEHASTLRSGIANGAGDVLAGLLLGHLLRGEQAHAALESSLIALDRVLAASEGQAVLKLSALTRNDA